MGDINFVPRCPCELVTTREHGKQFATILPATQRATIFKGGSIPTVGGKLSKHYFRFQLKQSHDIDPGRNRKLVVEKHKIHMLYGRPRSPGLKPIDSIWNCLKHYTYEELFPRTDKLRKPFQRIR